MQQSFSRVFVPDDAQVVPLFAGQNVQVTIAIEVENLDSVELDSSFSTADFVCGPIGRRWRLRRATRQPHDPRFAVGVLTADDDLQPTVQLDVGDAGGFPGPRPPRPAKFGSAPTDR